MSVVEGYLTKSPPKTTVDLFQFKQWKRRFCQLIQYDNYSTLEYKKSSDTKEIKGIINLNDAKYFATNFPFIRHRRNLFAIKIVEERTSRIFYFNASSTQDFEKWKNGILKVLKFKSIATTKETAEELILAGFLCKAPSTKDFKEFAQMLTQSLNVYGSTEINENVEKVEKRCKRYYEINKNIQSLNSDYMSPLPVRCSSMMSSGSSSNSDDNETNSQFSTTPPTPEVMLKLPLPVRHKPKSKPTNQKSLDSQSPDESQLTYLDSAQLDFPTFNSSTSLNNIMKDDAVEYSTIDINQTEALSKLRQKINDDFSK